MYWLALAPASESDVGGELDRKSVVSHACAVCMSSETRIQSCLLNWGVEKAVMSLFPFPISFPRRVVVCWCEDGGRFHSAGVRTRERERERPTLTIMPAFLSRFSWHYASELGGPSGKLFSFRVVRACALGAYM